MRGLAEVDASATIWRSEIEGLTRAGGMEFIRAAFSGMRRRGSPAPAIQERAMKSPQVTTLLLRLCISAKFRTLTQFARLHAEHHKSPLIPLTRRMAAAVHSNRRRR
jgi:hypothetical protein